jgi:hypothetical protein
MIEKLLYHLPFFNRQFDFNTEELSSIELAARTAQKMNEVIDLANTVDDKIALKEDSSKITLMRKLSESGVFTGWLSNKSVAQVLTDIQDTLSLAKTIIDMVNNRESIGTIYDGGVFLETDPPTFDIEGGLF